MGQTSSLVPALERPVGAVRGTAPDGTLVLLLAVLLGFLDRRFVIPAATKGGVGKTL